MSLPSPHSSNQETELGLQTDRETRLPGSDDQPPPWKQGDRLNEFLLEQLLGQGTSGYVYRAFEARAGQRWALKLLRPNASDDLLRNKLGFRRMISVEHPNLVAVNRIHQLGPYVGLSMEEVPGETFGRARMTLQQMEPAQAYDRLLILLREFASGLAEMHRRGLIHRDMKPANMMVRSDGVAKIIDYGLVDLFELDEIQCTPRGYFFGTPRYIAPEVYWRQQYLPSGDIFGLGIVFLETLLSIQSNEDQPATELTRSKDNQSEDGQRISEAIDELPDSVPGIIRETCRQMLSRYPADRPTAIELSRLGRSQATAVALPAFDALVGRHREMEQIQSWAKGIFNGGVGRLHLSGPPGIGKSRLLKGAIEYIESKKWGQLFFARCSNREELPMQAMDQICDAIASRYLRGDREPLELDPVNVAILKAGFPVLSNVLKSRIDLVPHRTTRQSIDLLEALLRMAEQLRLVGPLFLVIDDSQWADLGSRNVLDRLSLEAGSAGLGIITVSRERDSHRIPAQLAIEIGPLKLADSVTLLSQAAARRKIALPFPAIRQLASAANGSPHRLRELANEFRPGGTLSGSGGWLDKTRLDPQAIDQLWQLRVDRLSADARRLLPYVATAGGRMSTEQLGKLSGLHETIDAAVSELVQQRLITDDATGGECIEIVNDRVAEQMVQSLGEQATRTAHHRWASLLARNDNSHLSAARIAGHFFASGHPGQAVSHAVIAAEDAERRVALYEAAKLYVRVASHVEGRERFNQLRNAARCFRDAAYPLDAADCYRNLAELSERRARIDYQLMAACLLFRGGRFNDVRVLVRELAAGLGLPKSKPAPASTLALLFRQLGWSLSGRRRLLARLTEHPDASPQQRNELNPQTKQQLEFCFSLIRPLFFLDHLYAVELSVFNFGLLIKRGNAKMRLRAAVDEAVFSCHDKGRKRSFGEARLASLKRIATRVGDPISSGDVAAGIAFSHALSGRWSQVPEQVQASVKFYQESSDRFGFEIAQTIWLELWANWQLGQWRQLHESSLALHADAAERNDGFQQLIASGGYAAAGWLVADQVDRLQRIQSAQANIDMQGKQLQWPMIFQWAGLTQRLLYEGRYVDAWDQWQWIKPKLRRLPFSTVQLARVMHLQLGVVIALHQLGRRYSEPLILRSGLLIDQLRREQTPYALVLANLYGGLLAQRISQIRPNPISSRKAIQLLTSARDRAAAEQLKQFQLAASDALDYLESGTSPGQLIRLMETEGIAIPTQFQRLFTVDFSH